MSVLGLVLMSGVLAGCDSESLLSTGSADRVNRAVAVMRSDTDLYGHMDVPAMIQAVERLQPILGSELGLDESELDEAKLEFGEAFGMDMERDLHSATMGLQMRSSENPAVELVGFADLDIEEMAAHINRDSTRVQTVQDGDTTLLVDTAEERAIAAYLEEGMGLTASEESALYDMIARAHSGTISGFTHDAIVGRVLDTPLWLMVVDTPRLFSEAPAEFQSGDMAAIMTALSTVQSASLAIDPHAESFSLEAHLRPTESVSADDLASMLRGLVALARMQFQDTPMVGVLDQVDIDVDDGLVDVEIEVDASVLEALSQLQAEGTPLMDRFRSRF